VEIFPRLLNAQLQALPRINHKVKQETLGLHPPRRESGNREPTWDSLE